ncbi:MAG: hypothetical protein R6U41_06415 [Desulfosalsimonas sp.]|uniref:response regulator transcription factor n=1 Tax=Desulfosalsimonas sp. TaxID=3073848 RepID=UPI00397063EA
MGIDLKIDSAPGYGNRIILVIPHNLVQDTVPRLSHFEEHPKSVLSDTTEKETDLRDIRVIFVDDHQLMRYALVSMVKNHSEIKIVGEACNGQEALEIVRQVQPNLVVDVCNTDTCRLSLKEQISAVSFDGKGCLPSRTVFPGLSKFAPLNPLSSDGGQVASKMMPAGMRIYATGEKRS